MTLLSRASDLSMARLPRFLLSDQDAWYHLISRVAGPRNWYPFHDPEVAEAFLKILFRYLAVYFCDLADYVLMGNHFHLVARFQRYRQLSQRELERRAACLYPRPLDRPRTPRQWKHLNRRLFSVSAFMHDVKQRVAEWYNERYDRRGPLFAERFRSVVLADLEAVLDCLLYVDLNPVRAGLVREPEAWPWGALCQRIVGSNPALLPLTEILPGRVDPWREYRTRLYWRGGIEVRESGPVLDPRLLDLEIRRGYRGGEYRQSCPAFSRGVGLGPFHQICVWIGELRQRGNYRRRIHPIVQQGGLLCTLREQRGRYRLQFAPG